MLRPYHQMKNKHTQDATAVAVAVFKLIYIFGHDDVVYDIFQATDLILYPMATAARAKHRDTRDGEKSSRCGWCGGTPSRFEFSRSLFGNCRGESD